MADLVVPSLVMSSRPQVLEEQAIRTWLAGVVPQVPADRHQLQAQQEPPVIVIVAERVEEAAVLPSLVVLREPLAERAAPTEVAAAEEDLDVPQEASVAQAAAEHAS